MKKLLIIALMIGLPCYAETIGSVRNDWVKPIIEQEKQNKVITEAEFDKLYRTLKTACPNLYIYFIGDRDRHAYLKATDKYKPVTKLDLIHPVDKGYATVGYDISYKYLIKRYNYLGKDWVDYLTIMDRQQFVLRRGKIPTSYYYENISFPVDYCIVWINELNDYIATHSNPYTEKLARERIHQITLDFINYMYWDFNIRSLEAVAIYKHACEDYLAKPKDTEEYQIIKKWYTILESTNYQWSVKAKRFVNQLQ